MRTSRLPLIVSLAPQLPDELLTRRAAGESYAKLSDWLREAYAIDATDKTVARWVAALQTSEAAA